MVLKVLDIFVSIVDVGSASLPTKFFILTILFFTKPLGVPRRCTSCVVLP